VITASSFLDRLRCADEPIEAPIAIVVAHPDDETIGAGAQLLAYEATGPSCI
jgi:LmbE family N-acetylglucosaminyl deacetylase